MTVYPPHILQELKGYHLFLDTNVFVYASKNKDFSDFLVDLKNIGSTSFVTIPSVVFEFTNGSDSIVAYNKRIEFINSIVDSVNPMKFINDISDFYIVMSKINKQNKAYTDFLLSACVYNYRRAKIALLTTDVKAFPSFFPLSHIISVTHDKDIINFGVFQFDNSSYSKAAAKALSEAVS